jgi:hypothetical protein
VDYCQGGIRNWQFGIRSVQFAPAQKSWSPR